ncbi:MAG: hypothetical protein K0R54_913 [Clostridiaceae bacterium]|jgi:hypothetical protein|nr:hypothetical protein [Clostridiaceae bacterium]
MDVNNVMNTYYMGSVWNSINPMVNSSGAAAPLVNNVDSSVQENYTSMNYFGESANTELQNIFQQVEPNYGIPVTYNQSGDISMQTTTTMPASGFNAADSGILSLINSNNSSLDKTYENILNQYNLIEGGTFQSSFSSILSNNPYNVYSAVSSLGTNSTDSYGNFLNAML